ncbi:MAG TPA: methylmalonyl-CoA mutase family protein, partial [Gillisia sp.]|nr:methylmalonyl-CoA mutase family protein [Gillisia sp.]
MSRKDFQHIQLKRSLQKREDQPMDDSFATAEEIDLKPVYTEADIEDAEHLGFAAGIPPYLRGPYSTMFVSRPWTIRQYAGFSTAEESNAFYRRNLAGGQKG